MRDAINAKQSGPLAISFAFVAHSRICRLFIKRKLKKNNSFPVEQYHSSEKGVGRKNTLKHCGCNNSGNHRMAYTTKKRIKCLNVANARQQCKMLI